MIGEIDNKFFLDGADVDDPKIGKSRAFPTAQEIVVDKERSAPAGVGQLVDSTFFKDSPKLVFNVAFSCADSNPFKPGAYGDPHSIWFNVFFGYYEIDVAQKAWGRPFGYEADLDNRALGRHPQDRQERLELLLELAVRRPERVHRGHQPHLLPAHEDHGARPVRPWVPSTSIFCS